MIAKMNDGSSFYSTGVRLSLTVTVIVGVLVLKVNAQPAEVVTEPVVDVATGRLVGKTIDFDQEDFLGIKTKVDIFLGIPFANPPARFTAPTPKTPWEGEWNATYLRASCSQINDDPLQVPGSEDCLYLNVFAPHPKTRNAPVIVLFPGGAFKLDGASNIVYTSPSLAAIGDVIMVTIAYRVGVFGVFTTGDDIAPGNYAMLDQVVGLQWVQDNIEAFGGDKNSVTIVGQSAGAGSVGFHLISPLSANLFHRALLMSGSALAKRYFRNDPEVDQAEAKQLASLTGCPTTDSMTMVECLRTVDEQTLLEIQDTVYSSGYFMRLDGTFLEDSPANLLSKDQNPAAKLPSAIMVGFTKHEATFLLWKHYPEYKTSETGPPMNRSEFDFLLNKSLLGSDNDPLIKSSIYNQYVDWGLVDQPDYDYFDAYVSYFSDYIWRAPSDETLRLYYEMGVTDIYQYYFTQTLSTSPFWRVGDVNPTWVGASHAEDLALALGWPFDKNLMQYKVQLTDEEKVLSYQIIKMWANFAKSGNPTKEAEGVESDPELPAWPAFTVPELGYLDLSLNLTIRRAAEASGVGFWNRFIPDVRAVISQLQESSAGDFCPGPPG